MRQVCALGVLLHALAARAAPPGPSDRWSLVLSDDFDSFNASRWTKGWTWCDGHGHLRPQRVHKKAGDACYFADENVWVEDGRLVLENRHERRGGYDYTSGVVNTGPSFQTLYGYFEARILASPPSGAPGACPAFWLPNIMNAGDNGVGEIDVMEIPGGPHSGAGKAVWFTVHDGRSNASFGNFFYPTLTPPFLPAHWADGTFHTYAVHWEPGRLTFYVDGVQRFTTTHFVPSTPAYLVFDNEVGIMGDTWGGVPDPTAFPHRMLVDYVRVWHEDALRARNVQFY